MNHRPERVTLKNVETRLQLPFLLNPETLEEKYRVKYNNFQSYGVNGEVRQYVGNENPKYSVELLFDEFKAVRDQLEQKVDPSISTIEYYRRWLISLTKPDERTGEPPLVIFTWPNILKMTCRVNSLDIEHRIFFSNCSTRLYSAQMELEAEFIIAFEGFETGGGFGLGEFGSGGGF